MRDLRRDYPEISFVDREVDPLVRKLILAYEKFTDRTLFPGDPTRLFILWIADIIIQERVIINDTAKQNVPRYARGKFLDSLGELFRDTPRLGRQPSKTTLRFTLSAPLQSTQVVPQGTRARVGNDIFFATVENAGIPPGMLFTDVSAICITTEPDPITGEPVSIGAKANGFLPGQITQIVDVFPNFHTVENITTSEGGADQEKDDAYYVRMGEALESFTTAGSLGSYIFWAKTASPLIADVRPTSPEPGVADIRILLQGGQLPDDEMKRLVYDKLTGGDDGVRPFTDLVIVDAPEVVHYDIDLVYFIPRQRQDSEEVIIQRVEAAIEEYKSWQSERMGRDINPDRLTHLMKVAGMKRAEIASPQFTVLHDTQVAIIRDINVRYGGIEDE